MELDFAQIAPSIPYIVKGLGITLQFTLLSMGCGFVWGAVLSLLKISNIKLLVVPATIYTSIFRGTPLILQLVIIYFATPQLIGYKISELEAGVLAFALNAAAYISETIRGGIMAVDRGQRDAALALGLSYRRMMVDVVFPQALKNILPALVNESIALLKESALVSVIGVPDLMRRAQIVANEKYLYFEPLLIAGLIYYITVAGLTWGARRLETRLRRSD